MNERIRDLAEQAGATTVLFDREGHYHIVKPELQKFAELIVRECTSLFDGSKETKTAGLITHNQVVSQIKEHFGVE